MKSTRPLVAVVAALAVALAVLGFFFGMGSAPTAGDAKSERAAAYKDAVASGKKRGVYRRHYVRGYRKGFKAGERKARAERAKRRARERRTAAERIDRPRVGSNTTGGAAPSELGCDATYILPDGTTGCARNYGD